MIQAQTRNVQLLLIIRCDLGLHCVSSRVQILRLVNWSALLLPLGLMLHLTVLCINLGERWSTGAVMLGP